MSNLNVREPHLPAHSRQFDTKCRKIQFVSDPLEKQQNNLTNPEAYTGIFKHVKWSALQKYLTTKRH